jgi:hypothetical protein
VSRHWKPDEEVARVRGSRTRREWPAGATVGLALVAAACAGLVLTLYHVAGPRDSFADDPAGTPGESVTPLTER